MLVLSNPRLFVLVLVLGCASGKHRYPQSCAALFCPARLLRTFWRQRLQRATKTAAGNADEGHHHPAIIKYLPTKDQILLSLLA